MLLYYWGSKERMIQAVVEGVRRRQLTGFASIREASYDTPRAACLDVWRIMTTSTLQPLFRFFFELFGLALQDRENFGDFLHHAIEDWIAFFAGPLMERGMEASEARARATVLLAGFRGFLMDFCATGDRERIDRAVEIWLDALDYDTPRKDVRHAQ